MLAFFRKEPLQIAEIVSAYLKSNKNQLKNKKSRKFVGGVVLS